MGTVELKMENLEVLLRDLLIQDPESYYL